VRRRSHPLHTPALPRDVTAALAREGPGPALARVVVLKRVYVRDARGVVWRIYDGTRGPRGGVVMGAFTPSSRATHRVFISATGARRYYVFTPGEQHLLTLSRVVQQLRRSHAWRTARCGKRAHTSPDVRFDYPRRTTSHRAPCVSASAPSV
jgi:hypothetical protein